MRILSYRDLRPGRFSKALDRLRGFISRGEFAAAGLKKLSPANYWRAKLAAEVMEEIGWNTRLSDLSEQQVFTLMEVAVGGFQDAMRDIAAANKQSPEVPF